MTDSRSSLRRSTRSPHRIDTIRPLHHGGVKRQGQPGGA